MMSLTCSEGPLMNSAFDRNSGMIRSGWDFPMPLMSSRLPPSEERPPPRLPNRPPLWVAVCVTDPWGNNAPSMVAVSVASAARR